jgi:hypothetical protein
MGRQKNKHITTNQQKPAKRTNNLVDNIGSCLKKIADKNLVKKAGHMYSRQVKTKYIRPAKILKIVVLYKFSACVKYISCQIAA